jgi:putative restriction endonuclease
LTPTLHKLFDHGAWSLDDSRRVIVSRHFSESDVALGELRALEGRPLRAPAPGYAPFDLECIRWHREPELGGVFRT